MRETPPIACPKCASGDIMPRASLFRRLMHAEQLPAVFDWYSSALPGSCPPKSLVILLAFALLGLLVPGLLLWYFNFGPALQLLGLIVALLLVATVLDLSITLGRYRSWRREWICGYCRSVHTLS